MANNMKPETMLMSGVTVDFPYTPYPCQIAMLARIIKALQQSKNCLLESPTGTGKTLTLLCASLAWQQKEIEQFRMSTPFIENKDNATEAQTKPTPVSRIFYCTRTHKQLEQIAKQLNNTVYKDKIRMTLLSSRDNYCIHPIISKGPNKSHECAKITRHNHDRSVTQGVNSECGYYERLRGKVANDFLRPFAKPLPRVFDIEQFNDHCQNSHGVCPYYTSRLLINDVQLILCPYNYLIDPRVRNSMQVSITNAIIIIDEAHNIEDCARESMKFEVRKYDFEQALQELCTNQKVLDLAQIKIAELIVNESGFALTQEPLSSSHLTSSQRESTHRASGYSEYDELNDDTDLLDHLRIDQHGNQHETIPETNDKVTSEYADFANAVKFLAERFSRLILWFDEKDPREKYAFTPKQLIEQFHQAKFIDQSVVDVHKPAVKNRPAATRHRVVKDAVRVRKALSKGFLNKPDYVKFSDETVKFLEDFDLCLSILYADDYQFADEYKIVLKTIPFEPSASAIAQMQQRPQISTGDAEDNQWIDKRSQSSQFKRYQPNVTQTTYPIHTQQLIFYCLSPSVAFAKDLRLARSLIFASGTLAPLATYAGELKIPFDIQMECNHVIDLDRTFMTALSHGRNPNVKLRATYQNTDKIEFQDECGLIVLDVCQRVPYGVLCFLPSYRFLNVIMSRWMASGLWQKLNEHKAVFFEEKSSATFQNTMNRFREANGTLQIDKSLTAAAKRVKAMFKRKTVPSASSLADLQHVPVKGGLLLAVCRGRASEGIDFSDNNARCVITLGIPYPNVQDEEVVFKRNYNNEQNKRMPQVMNGSDWYDSQAYRALNQALGRCIRHKNDWGALVIVDERIVQNMSDKHFNNKISLWIKQRLCISRKYDDTMNALEKFVEHMQKSVEIERLKNEQKEQNQEAEKNLTQDEQNQNSEKKLSEEEQRRFAFAFPSIKELPKTIGENKPTHREWQITDLSDDESAKENQPSSIKQEAFGKYVAQRQLCMTPPSIPSQNNNETQKEKAIDPKTSSNHQNIRNRVQRHKKTPIKRFHSQRAVSTSSSPILPQKIDLFRTQKVIILSDDDDDDDDDDDGDGDFIKSKVCFHQPSKKVKTDKSFV
ncbi:unnamed protein product [Rotaria socialis]|uniref:Helicase ATP-binding domain-containing protein n=1 Tax=Rotaria socialis TaxID=392032 RepID=A0A818HB14_9BILA|nr:unnamed protein product [Rotaria socialis]